MSLNPLYLAHLKRCMNVLSVAMLNAEQPDVSRLGVQPGTLEKALRRLQQGLDETGGLIAIETWQPDARSDDLRSTVVAEQPSILTPRSSSVAEPKKLSAELQTTEVSTPPTEFQETLLDQPNVVDTPPDRAKSDEHTAELSVVAAPMSEEPVPEPTSPAPPMVSDRETAYEEYTAESVEIPLDVQPSSEQGFEEAIPTASEHSATISMATLRTQQARAFFQAVPWQGGDLQGLMVSRLQTKVIAADPQTAVASRDLPLAQTFFQNLPWRGGAAATDRREGFSLQPGSQVAHLHLYRDSAGMNPIMAATASALSTSRQAKNRQDTPANEFFRQLPWAGQVAVATGS